MKFTKEQVLENIKAKLANSQKLTDRTILETVEPLLSFASEETELTDFVDRVYPAVDSANRNLIKEQSDFVKNYKPETPAPAQSTTPAPASAPQAFDMNALAELIAQNSKTQLETFQQTISELQTKIQSFETQKTVSEIISGGWTKHQNSNPYPELEAFAKIAKDQTDAKASSFKTADEWYESFSQTYNQFASATGKESGYVPLDNTGNPIAPKSQFEQNVQAIIASEAANSGKAIAERLGI